MNDTPLLRIEDLSVQYMTDEDVVHAVNGLNVELYKGESLGFVGETGAGKTTAALSVIQLLPEPAGVITGGSIWYNGRNLIENKEKENVEMRGDGISMIFQDPMTALNPTLRISRQMMEVVESHRKVSRREAETICIDMPPYLPKGYNDSKGHCAGFIVAFRAYGLIRTLSCQEYRVQLYALITAELAPMLVVMPIVPSSISITVMRRAVGTVAVASSVLF